MDPGYHAPGLQAAAEQKNVATWPCPVDWYGALRSVKRVADWACGGDFQKAEKLRDERPAMYKCILVTAEAEAEAEPHAMKYAQTKADAKPRADAQAKKPLGLAGNRVGQPST